MKEAFFDGRYSMASWVSVGLIFCHEMIGNNGIMLYSNQLLKKMGNDNSSYLNARQGTYIIGAVTLFSSATSIFCAKCFTRRFLFINGHVAIGAAHICVGIFAYFNQPTLALISMCLFIIFY